MLVVAVLSIAALLLSGCPAPTPQVIEVPKEVVVEKKVVETVEVVKEVPVEKVVKETVVVEKEKIVEATPVPQQIVEFAGSYPADSPWGKEHRLLGYRLEEEHPECKFVYSEYVGTEGAQVVLLRLQEGDPPDIGGAVHANSLMPGGGEQWKAGYIHDLADDMQTPPYGQTEGTWWDTFNAAAQEQMAFDSHVGEVSYMQSQAVLWYNTAHYETYGLEPPATWGELMANCEVLKQNGQACIGGGGFNGYVGYWYDMLLFRLMGNEAQYALYNGTDPQYKWTDPEPIKAAQMLVDMITAGYAVDGYVGGDFTAMQVVYFTGEATHIFVGTWLMAEMQDSIPEDFAQAVIFFPTVEGYEDKTPYESTFGFQNWFSVYAPGAQAKESHSTECAVEWLKLFTDKDVQTSLVESLDFVSTIKGVPGPANIPGIGELLSSMKLWFPACQNLFNTHAELPAKYWDNITLLATEQLTPEEFGERMQQDWDEYFARTQ
jgi:ABC-type glycerol-3-phosphate transport system substrate-binding protein